MGSHRPNICVLSRSEEKVNSERRAREAAVEARELRDRLEHAEGEIDLLRRSLGDSTRTFASHQQQAHGVCMLLEISSLCVFGKYSWSGKARVGA